ncbi:MAG: tetraacyldisaccharide 4'-kinase [Bacteroidales bacterium]|nr:tetraacyldisaccharide 4'-kinase [Bacteroidales bacterium]
MLSSQSRKKLFIITWPVSILYGLITTIRNKLYDYGILKSTCFPFPVISVGNLTVGGTGKTPHVEYLIRLLKDLYPIALLSRGYKRKTSEFRIVDSHAAVDDVGDEPKQIKNKFPEVMVAVDRDRVNGINEILKTQKKTKAVLLDDAFQHRAVNPGLSVLLIDFNNPVSNDFMLPFGNLREHRKEIKRAHILIVTKTPKKLKPIEKKIWIKNLKLYPYQFLYFTTYTYGDPAALFNTHKRKLSLSEMKKENSEILLITGIANPLPLVNELKSYTKKLIHIRYPDHHTYSAKDFIHIKNKFETVNSQNKYIVTTEKDTVKISEMKTLIDKQLCESIYYISVKVEFLFNGGEEFNKNLIRYVKTNKEINRLHK